MGHAARRMRAACRGQLHVHPDAGCIILFLFPILDHLVPLEIVVLSLLSWFEPQPCDLLILKNFSRNEPHCARGTNNEAYSSGRLWKKGRERRYSS